MAWYNVLFLIVLSIVVAANAGGRIEVIVIYSPLTPFCQQFFKQLPGVHRKYYNCLRITFIPIGFAEIVPNDTPTAMPTTSTATTPVVTTASTIHTSTLTITTPVVITSTTNHTTSSTGTTPAVTVPSTTNHTATSTSATISTPGIGNTTTNSTSTSSSNITKLVEFNPFKNSRIQVSGRNGGTPPIRLHCSFGERECDYIKYHACMIKRTHDLPPFRQTELLQCTMDGKDDAKNRAKMCIERQNPISNSMYNDIEECATTNGWVKYVQEFYDWRKLWHPKLPHIPLIIVNGVEVKTPLCYNDFDRCVLLALNNRNINQ